MTAIHPFNQTSPDTEAYSRLFLREEELQFGLASLFEAMGVLKGACDEARLNNNLSWAEVKTLLSVSAKADSVLNLGIRLAVTKQALTKTLRELEKKQLLQRIEDRRDKRRKIISITKNGRELLQTVITPMRKLLARSYKNAGADKVLGFDQVLWAIIGANNIGKKDD